jgi:hypothetical protein
MRKEGVASLLCMMFSLLFMQGALFLSYQASLYRQLSEEKRRACIVFFHTHLIYTYACALTTTYFTMLYHHVIRSNQKISFSVEELIPADECIMPLKSATIIIEQIEHPIRGKTPGVCSLKINVFLQEGQIACTMTCIMSKKVDETRARYYLWGYTCSAPL